MSTKRSTRELFLVALLSFTLLLPAVSAQARTAPEFAHLWTPETGHTDGFFFDPVTTPGVLTLKVDVDAVGQQWKPTETLFVANDTQFSTIDPPYRTMYTLTAPHPILGDIRVKKLSQPYHTQIPLHRRGEAHPVIRPVRYFVVIIVGNGGNRCPVGIFADRAENAVGGKDYYIRIPKHNLFQVYLVAGSLAGRILDDSQVVAEQIDYLCVVRTFGDNVQSCIAGAI